MTIYIRQKDRKKRKTAYWRLQARNLLMFCDIPLPRNTTRRQNKELYKIPKVNNSCEIAEQYKMSQIVRTGKLTFQT